MAIFFFPQDFLTKEKMSKHCFGGAYPVVHDSLVSVLATVEEDITGSFQKLQDELGVSSAQSDILSHLTTT